MPLTMTKRRQEQGCDRTSKPHTPDGAKDDTDNT